MDVLSELEDDRSGIRHALSLKADPTKVDSWIKMVTDVEGRDKTMKAIQFGSRCFDYISNELTAGTAAHSCCGRSRPDLS